MASLTLKADIRKWVCPRACGWYRAYHYDPVWLNDTIEHRVYGKVHNFALVRLEVVDHDCSEYLKAQQRLAYRREKNKTA